MELVQNYLEETNIEDADFFILTTGNDEANLLSCILVKKYNVPTIIARVSNPDHEEALWKSNRQCNQSGSYSCRT